MTVAGKRLLGRDALELPGDRFSIVSNTKAMTSSAIVALSERGGPALALTLRQAFGAWADKIHPAYAGVTLADLLHHRGAVPAFDGGGPEEESFLAAVATDTKPLTAAATSPFSASATPATWQKTAAAGSWVGSTRR